MLPPILNDPWDEPEKRCFKEMFLPRYAKGSQSCRQPLSISTFKKTQERVGSGRLDHHHWLGGGEKKKKKALENTLYLPFQSTNSHLRLPFGMGIVLFAVSSESVRRISFISPPLPILEPFPAPSTRKAPALLISLRRWWRPRWKSHRSSADCSF